MKLPIWIANVAVLALCGCSDPDSGRIVGPTLPDASGDLVQSSAGSVTLRSGSPGYTFGIQWRFFSGAACSSGAGSTLAFPAVTASGVTFSVTTWASMEVTASTTSSVGSDFAQWSGPGGPTVDRIICVPAPVDAQVYTATYGQNTNTPPVLDAIGNQVVDEGATLTFDASASDVETPAASLIWSVAGAPPGAVLLPTGAFSWSPSEADGPGAYSFDLCVHDDGTPALNDCETINVTVHEVNQAPVMDPIPDQNVDLGSTVSFTAIAHDPDEPANGLAFSLSGAPAGATVDASTGSFSWTPTTGGSFSFDVIVTDDGTPALSSSQHVVLTVNFVPPEIVDVTPADGSVVRVMTPVDFTASFVAAATQNEGTCRTIAEAATSPMIEGSQGIGKRTCTSTIEFRDAGEFDVTFTLSDMHGVSDSRTMGIVAYDPAAGSVTANGWLDSGAGALTANPAATGRATFHFNSSYSGAAHAPTGYTAFQLPAAGLTFVGRTQTWLIVDVADRTSSFKGAGSLVGRQGSFGYQVWLHDGDRGQPDGIRIRIWRASDEADVIYDSGAIQPVGGGAVIISGRGRH